MRGHLLVFTLILGLSASLPTKSLRKTLRNGKNTASNDRLGIYDGTNTTIAKHPYLVGILAYGKFICAGAILSESYAITIANCVDDYPAANLTIVAGSSDGTTGTTYSVQERIVNPDYEELYGNYNYALIKIQDTFAWGNTIGNVTLPSANPKSGAALVAVGWGTDSALAATTSTLRQGTMKYVTETNCVSYYHAYDTNFDVSMACAYNQGKTTLCHGDYGDPFTKDNVLYGLMADGGGTGEFCNNKALPIIIANIHTAVKWIKEYI